MRIPKSLILLSTLAAAACAGELSPEFGSTAGAGSSAAGSSSAAGAAGVTGAVDGGSGTPGASGSSGAGGATETCVDSRGNAVAIADIPTDIIEASCSMNGCHNAGSPNGAFLAAEMPASLMDVAAVGCTNQKLIDSANPDASYFLNKVAEVTPECGNAMPIGNHSDDIALCVRLWINSVTTP